MKGLVTAEIFTDFMSMADYFLSEGYKDPAAVIGGSALEQHLRQLCIKHGMPVSRMDPQGNQKHKMGDELNADLARAQVYQKTDQKNVISWLGIRNGAAHGKFNEYTTEQVALMLQGITDFMARKPI